MNRTIAGCLVLLLFSACSGSSVTDTGPSATEGSGSGQPVPTQVAIPARTTVSYAEASEWLMGVPPEDREDQIRDWVALGVAGLMRLDVETLRNSLYDKTPVRDPLFNDTSRNPIGRGRSFLDSVGILHLVVPQSDPYLARTVGLLLDEHRKDAGIDPENVQFHRYLADPATKSVSVASEAPTSTRSVRAAHGYRAMPIATLDDLKRFLDETVDLSRVGFSGDQLWLEGWHWPGIPAGKITDQDVAVLQKGYREAAAGRSSEPGFSLDPKPPLKDFKELAGILSVADFPRGERIINDVLQQFVSLQKEPSLAEFERVILDIRSRYQGKDEVLATVAMNLVLKQTLPSFQAARYDGGLGGSEAGMTYFYTDIVAKAWPMEKGLGAPNGKVPGFTSDLQAKTPLGFCQQGDESGRLWFGLREEAISITEQHIDFGSVATRLFSKVEDPGAPESEIEPSYKFGRIMWWWDRHYTAMADYEPQYHRLDQLMRWGSAIGWLVNKGVYLPELPPNQIRQNWRFDLWLAEHPELKWQYDIPFVHPPNVTTEALLTLESKPYEDCSGTFTWSGGISNPSLRILDDIQANRAALGPELLRGGVNKLQTEFSAASRTGTIGNAALKHDIKAITGETARVEIVAEARKVWPLSQLKTWVSDTAQRRLSMNLASANGRIKQSIAVQGVEMGELSVTAQETVASIRWKSGPLSKARDALGSIQKAMSTRPVDEAIAAAEGISLLYKDPATAKTLVRLDSEFGAKWIQIEKNIGQAQDDMVFRLAAPGKPGEEMTWYSAKFSLEPSLPAEGNAQWFTVERSASSGPARIKRAQAPGPAAEELTAQVADANQRGRFFVDAEGVHVNAVDPVFGINGMRAGPDLLDLAAVERVRAAKRAAQQASDGNALMVNLANNTIAVVDQKTVTLVPTDHPFHVRVRAALKQGNNDRMHVRVQADRPLIAEKTEIVGIGQEASRVEISDLLKALKDETSASAAPRGPPVYMESQLAQTVGLEEGRIPPGTVATGWRVRVVETPHSVSVAGIGMPDLRLFDGSEWARIGSGAGPAAGQAIRIIFRGSDCDAARTEHLRCKESK